MTTELALLSLSRAKLPSFPGDTLSDQLQAGRAAALAALQKYVPNLAFDLDQADQVLREVGAWEDRNDADLRAVMQDASVEELPEQIRIALGADKTQQWILAGYTRAAMGLGPWQSGAVARAAAAGGDVNLDWAQADAAYRLQVFGTIVRLDEDGYLQKIFVPPGDGAAGFGIVPVVVWAVVVVLVAVAALVLLYVYASKRLDQNNRLMRDLCEKAQRDGDTATVNACIQATKDLQLAGMIPGLSEFGATLAKVLGLGALAYGAFWLWSSKKRRSA